jgi:hypothetical protein
MQSFPWQTLGLVAYVDIEGALTVPAPIEDFSDEPQLAQLSQNITYKRAPLGLEVRRARYRQDAVPYPIVARAIARPDAPAPLPLTQTSHYRIDLSLREDVGRLLDMFGLVNVLGCKAAQGFNVAFYLVGRAT